MDRKTLIVALAVVVIIAAMPGWSQQEEPKKPAKETSKTQAGPEITTDRGEERDQAMMEHWKSRGGRTWEQFIEEWMTPQPFPKKTAIKIDDRYAYPHIAAAMKMEIVREDEDTVWLRGLSPENPASPLYKLWARRQADEALLIAQAEIAQKPGAAYVLDYEAEEVPPPFMDSLDFELSGGRALADRGRWQMGFAMADMNEDGIPDLIFPPQRKGYPVQPSIFLGDGKGGFKMLQDVQWPNQLPFDYGGVAAGDFNGDGHQDLIFAIHLRAQYVVWGNGTKKFTEFELLKSPDPRIPSRAATVADFDGNGQPDVAFIAEIDYDMATSRAIESARTVWIQYRRGDSWELSGEGLPQNLIADVIRSADMNGDGRPDLVLSSNAVNWRQLVYLNGADGWEPAEHRGTLSSAYHYDVQPFGDDVLAAFVQFNIVAGETEARNGLIRYPLSFEEDKWVDGKPVLWNKDRVNVFFRLGVGDIDGDGLLDVVASRKSGGLEVYLQNDVGDFSQEKADNLADTGRAFDIRVLDLNGDGLDDIIACFTPQQDRPGGVRVWLTKKAG